VATALRIFAGASKCAGRSRHFHSVAPATRHPFWRWALRLQFFSARCGWKDSHASDYAASPILVIVSTASLSDRANVRAAHSGVETEYKDRGVAVWPSNQTTQGSSHR